MQIARMHASSITKIEGSMILSKTLSSLHLEKELSVSSSNLAGEIYEDNYVIVKSDQIIISIKV